MPTERTLRRRGRPSAATEDSGTTEVTSETTEEPNRPSGEASPTAPVKSVPQLLEEEQQNMSNFLMLASAVAVFFAFMIHNTQLPPRGRVFGVMIDAGSTGTRAQVFTFRKDQDSNSLVLDKTQMFAIPRSLAALASGTAGSGKAFFRPLLDKVKKGVPGMRRRKATPIALRATAGLRLLGEVPAERALAMARQALNESEFLFQNDWVSILEEEEEAAHAWTTVNYLLGNMGTGKEDPKYHGALELGGASMQVVYKRDEESAPEAEKGSNVDPGNDDDNLEASITGEVMDSDTSVEVLGATHQLHTTSYLGLGLLDFTKKLYLLFDKEGVLEEGNPCFRKDKEFVEKTLRFGVPGSEETRVVSMVGDGDFDRCVASAEITIATFSKLYSAKTKLPSKTPFYAFAYFYDRTVGLGLPAKPNKKKLIAKGKQLCEAHPDVVVKGDTDEACAEFSYVYALVKHFTNDFTTQDTVQIRFEQFVEGHMLGWALGAMLETVQPVMSRQLKIDDEPLMQ